MVYFPDTAQVEEVSRDMKFNENFQADFPPNHAHLDTTQGMTMDHTEPVDVNDDAEIFSKSYPANTQDKVIAPVQTPSQYENEVTAPSASPQLRRSSRTPRPRSMYQAGPATRWDPNEYNSQTTTVLPGEDANDRANVHIGQALTVNDGPESFEDVMDMPSGDIKEAWLEAVKKEVSGMLGHKTFKAIRRDGVPQGRTIAPYKTVYKSKMKPNGEFDKLKCRINYGGHRQVEGVDFADIFAPTLRSISFRLMCSQIVLEDMETEVGDFPQAFLQGVLEEPVYMTMPAEVYWYLANVAEDNLASSCERDKLVLEVHGNMYGLHQAPAIFHNQVVVNTLVERLKLKRMHKDSCIFKHPTRTIYVMVYVDDCLIAAKTEQEIKTVSNLIQAHVDYKPMGSLEDNGFTGIQAKRDRQKGTLHLTLSTYIQRMLKKFGMEGCRTVRTPLPPGLKLGKGASEIEQQQDGYNEFRSEYQRSVGALLYVSVQGRPDISYAVGQLTRFMSNPAAEHRVAMKHVLRYLCGSHDLGITYHSGGNHVPIGYSDSSYALCPHTSRSPGGYVFIRAHGPIIWRSYTPKLVSQSSAEAELVILNDAAKDAVYIREWMSELGIEIGEPIPIHEDNDACRMAAKNNFAQSRMRHVRVRYHHVADQVNNNTVRVESVDTVANIADIFTKALGFDPFNRHRATLLTRDKSGED